MAGRRGKYAWGALAGALALLAVPGVAPGATFTANKRGDHVPGACTTGDCTLREAVLAANASGGSDTIRVPSRGTYQLSIPDAGGGASDGDLDVAGGGLRIVHPGKGRATVDNNPAGDGLPDPLDRVFETALATPLTLKKIVVTDGGDPVGSGRGGGIRALGNVRLVRSRVVGNEANDLGGGISVESGASILVRRSQVIGNRTTFNAGGGISMLNGELAIDRSVVKGNSADSDGGGIYFDGDDSVATSTIRDSTIANNRADGNGGAISADDGALTITGSTFSGNRALNGDGGAIWNDEFTLRTVNSTFTRNRATGVGGAIDAHNGENELNAVTVVRNLANTDGIGSEAGGGIFAGEFSDPVEVSNSLIALNRLVDVGGGGTLANDCSGEPFASGGHNLLSTRFLCDGFDQEGDIARSNPKIGPLARNGGPTQTVGLKSGSPAIGKADRQSSPARDQRGNRRDGRPDIGAFER